MPEQSEPGERERARVVILAAGAARRMGRPKQLLLYQGRTLLENAVQQARATGCPVDIVLGAEADRCRAVLTDASVAESQVRMLHNADWEEGMASSLRLGVASAPEDCRALLVMLCDQPRIPGTHFVALIDAWLAGPSSIVASAYGDGVGVPAVFGREHFADLMRLQGDRGARALLVREAGRVQTLACPEAAFDLDRPEDLRALEEG